MIIILQNQLHFIYKFDSWKKYSKKEHQYMVYKNNVNVIRSNST